MISQSIHFDASPAAIYSALVDGKKFSRITGDAPAQIGSKPGEEFALFGGMISGRNVEMVPDRMLVQAWRAGNWEEGAYSIVRFDLTEAAGGTKLHLTHVGYPESEHDHLEAGWKSNYWEGLKTLG